MIPNLYLISINKQREERAINEIKNIGFPEDKINIEKGVNGRDYFELEKARKKWNFVVPGKGIDSNRGLYTNFSNTEQGCCASHLNVMERIASSKQNGLVVEDDIVFHPSFLKYLRMLSGTVAQNDIVFLGWSEDFIPKTKGLKKLLFLNYKTYGTHCYLISPTACEKIIAYADGASLRSVPHTKTNQINIICDHWFHIYDSLGLKYTLYNPLGHYERCYQPTKNIGHRRLYYFFGGIAFQEDIPSEIGVKRIAQFKQVEGTGEQNEGKEVKETESKDVIYDEYEKFYGVYLNDVRTLKITAIIDLPEELINSLNSEGFMMLSNINKEIILVKG